MSKVVRGITPGASGMISPQPTYLMTLPDPQKLRWVYAAKVSDLILPSDPGTTDTTPPTPSVSVTWTPATISGQPGRDTSQLTFVVDEDYQKYELRQVTAENSTRASGILIESGSGGLVNVARVIDATYAELVAAAAAVEGDSRYKIFVQDLAGNWSS